MRHVFDSIDAALAAIEVDPREDFGEDANAHEQDAGQQNGGGAASASVTPREHSIVVGTDRT